MSLITWSKQLSVGVAEMDNQHQKLVQMINDLNDAMAHGKGKDVIGQILARLVAYTQTHFRSEERLLEKNQYPDLESHKKLHVALVAKIREFEDGYNRGQIGLSIEIMKFLSDWLTKHIQGNDKKYGLFLNENGVQ